jgi:hypothetical protein
MKLDNQNQKYQNHFNCLMVEAFVKDMVLRGITDNEKIVKEVNDVFYPTTAEEMEMYSEAIIYAKLGVLN